MTNKADFNAEEWSTILQGPPIAGMIVISSERGGTIRESVSMARAPTTSTSSPSSGRRVKPT